MAYSYSRIQTFKQCPQKYKFQYLDRIDTGRETIEAFMGQRVHESLEKLYREAGLTKLNTLEDLLAYYGLQWEKNWHANVVVTREGIEPAHYKELGRRCLSDYYQTYQPFNQSRTLALEERIEIRLANGAVAHTLAGYIDRMAYAPDGTYEIHDYKTSGTLPAQEDIEKDEQLPLYQIGLSQKWLDATRVKLIWHYLVFNKELSVVCEAKDLAELERITLEAIHRIEQETEFAPRKSALCDWCEFRSICPVWKHTTAVEKLSPEEFGKDAGVNLVKRYAELEMQKSEIEKEIDKLKDQAIAYAEAGGVTVIDGGDYQLKVETKEEVKVPTKRENPAAWEKLRSAIITAGKWEDVSYLSWAALTRVFRYRLWPESLISAITQFVTKVKRKEVSLVKKFFR